MHIDHNKLLDLLTDASGIEPEKVEQQIGELIEEIQHAIADNEAYEIEGFGIFSGLGNRVLFIPSKELETEINFKYVGMEPIELEDNQIKEEKEEEADPFEELQGTPTERKRDPFAGLVEGYEEDTEEEYQPGPDEWGIEAHKEDDNGANRLLSSLMGEEFGDEEQESEPETEQNLEVDSTEIEEVEDPVSFDDIFGEAESSDAESESDESEQEESVDGLDAELANLMSEESDVKSEDELAAGIMGDDFADIFGEDEEESDPEEEQEELIEAESLEDIEEEEAIDELVEALSEIEEDQLEELEEETSEEEDEVSEKEETEAVEETEPEALEEPAEESETEIEDEFDDFDDPFLDLEDEEPEEVVETQKTKEEIPIPVITNISSDLEPTKKEEPKKKENPKKEKKPKKSKDPKPAPVFLWIILALLIIIGTTVGLGYFSIINIPGITPQVASNTIPAVTPPPPLQEETPPPVQEEETPEELPDIETPTPQPPAQEQEQVTEVPVTTDETEVPSDQDKYGIMGVANTAANDGYTIVLFSLSVEANAFAKQQELTNDGFRALVTPISSAQYGTLYRVSIGQFGTLTDAAIAAEDMPSEYRQSYFIKRITN